MAEASSARGKIKDMKRPIELTVFLGDTHVPYQDVQAIRSVVNFIKDTQPDRIVHVGDLVDFKPISRFDKDPRKTQNLQKEIEMAGELLDQLREAAGRKCQIYYLEGNHEFRMSKYLMSRAPELIFLKKSEEDILSVPYLLDLKKRGIEFVPIDKSMKLYNFNVEHGDRASKFSAYTARNMLDSRRVNTIIGHTHRLGSYYYTGAAESNVAFEMGCLIDRESDGADYAKYPNWQLGFGVGEYHKDEGLFQVTPIMMDSQRRFIFRDKVYKPEMKVKRRIFE